MGEASLRYLLALNLHKFNASSVHLVKQCFKYLCIFFSCKSILLEVKPFPFTFKYVHAWIYCKRLGGSTYRRAINPRQSRHALLPPWALHGTRRVVPMLELSRHHIVHFTTLTLGLVSWCTLHKSTSAGCYVCGLPFYIDFLSQPVLSKWPSNVSSFHWLPWVLDDRSHEVKTFIVRLSEQHAAYLLSW